MLSFCVNASTATGTVSLKGSVNAFLILALMKLWVSQRTKQRHIALQTYLPKLTLSRCAERKTDLYIQDLVSCARGPNCCNAFCQKYDRKRWHHEELLAILKNGLHDASWAWVCMTQAMNTLCTQNRLYAQSKIPHCIAAELCNANGGCCWSKQFTYFTCLVYMLSKKDEMATLRPRTNLNGSIYLSERKGVSFYAPSQSLSSLTTELQFAVGCPWL